MRKPKVKCCFTNLMIFVMLIGLFPASLAVQPVQAEEQNDQDNEVQTLEVLNSEIPENHLRVHFEKGDLNVADLRLWIYEDVATWSEEEDSWPNGMAFPEGQVTEYGPYVDIELIQNPELVEMIIINEGVAILDAVQIYFISENMDEVWISENGDISLYEPVDLEENQLRIHYYNEDASYEPWGLWLWEDVLIPSEERDAWPLGAQPFFNNQVGKHGAYIDVDYKENASRISFLFANREDGDQQFGDITFSDLENHDQIFIRERENRAYTNPYYIREEVEQVETNAKIPEWSKDSVLYEVNVRQYTEEGTFDAFEEHLPRLKELGVDILWFMPIHPISEERRNGELGSYYAVQDYTEINPEFGTIEDFQRLVDIAQDMGFYVVLDWVANHTGWDHEWIEEKPEYYEQNDDGEIIHPQEFGWTDVAQLNFNNEDLRQEMKAAMMYWVEEVGVDGYRADYASGVPVDFWEDISAQLNEVKPVFMLAEDNREYDLLNEAFHVNWGWDFHHIMNDIATGDKDKNDVISHFEDVKDLYPIGTYPMQFIDSHDENSWEGTIDERLGDAADTMATLYFTVPGIPLIYSGQEAGLDKRLAFFDKDEIDWSDLSKQGFYQDLIQLKKSNEALWNGKAGGEIQILDTSDEHILAFERGKNDNKVVVIMNISSEEVSGTVDVGSSAGVFKSYFTNSEFTLEENHSIDIAAWDYHVFVQGEQEQEEQEEQEPPNEKEEKLQELKDLIADLTNRIEELKNNKDIDDLKKHIEDLEQEMLDIKTKYQELEYSTAEFEQLLNTLKAEMESLKEILIEAHDGEKVNGTSSAEEVDNMEDPVYQENEKEETLGDNAEESMDYEKGEERLPDTATSTFTLLMIGMSLFVIGSIIYYIYRKKRLVE